MLPAADSAAISVERLTYRYPPLMPGVPSERVLDGVDLCVGQGEFVALMGPTGVGKTTLCLALNGIVPQSTGGVIGGQVTVLGQDARQTPVAQLARHVSIVFQDPDSQLFSATVEAEVAFGPENLGIPRGEIAQRITWALRVVGLDGQTQRSPARLSGGQKQRVAIAAALAMLPQVLILDEPTAALDPLGRAEVLDVIERLRRDQNMTILMVSQDAEHIATYADRVAIMLAGRIAAIDTPERVFRQQDLLYEAGVAPPQMMHLAASLNQRFHTRFSFSTVQGAESALRSDLASR